MLVNDKVTGNFLTCLGQDANPGSGERQLAASGNALDHTADRAGPRYISQDHLLTLGMYVSKAICFCEEYSFSDRRIFLLTFVASFLQNVCFYSKTLFDNHHSFPFLMAHKRIIGLMSSCERWVLSHQKARARIGGYLLEIMKAFPDLCSHHLSYCIMA